MVEALHRAVPPPPGTDIENQTHPAFLANSEAGLGGTEAIAYQTIPLTFATPGPEHGHVWYSSKHEKSTMEAPHHCEHIAGGPLLSKKKKAERPQRWDAGNQSGRQEPCPRWPCGTHTYIRVGDGDRLEGGHSHWWPLENQVAAAMERQSKGFPSPLPFPLNHPFPAKMTNIQRTAKNTGPGWLSFE